MDILQSQENTLQLTDGVLADSYGQGKARESWGESRCCQMWLGRQITEEVIVFSLSNHEQMFSGWEILIKIKSATENWHQSVSPLLWDIWGRWPCGSSISVQKWPLGRKHEFEVLAQECRKLSPVGHSSGSSEDWCRGSEDRGGTVYTISEGTLLRTRLETIHATLEESSCVLPVFLKSEWARGWRDGCSSIGPEMNSQQPHGSSHHL